MSVSAATVNLAEPYLRGIGPLPGRHPQRDGELKLPPGTTVVSCDTHWEVSDDVFYENFPARLKDKAPRVWFDGFWHIGYKDVVEAYPVDQKGKDFIPSVIGDGLTDFGKRYEHFDAEGVELDICFPQTLFAFVRYPDLEVQENMYRVWNECVARPLEEKSGGRTFCVGIFPNWWDPAAYERSMRQIVDLGFKTFMIPLTLANGPDGRGLSYADPQFDRFWAVAEESGLPICLHVGEDVRIADRGGVAANGMALFSPFRKHFGQLVFGGVLDRNPGLQFVFVEGGASWVPPALQDAEKLYDTFGKVLDPPIKHRPSHYWHNNFHAVFEHDRLALRQLDVIGANRLLWSNDYPHTEGTFGCGRTAIRTVVETVASADDARAILGGNAIELFRLRN